MCGGEGVVGAEGRPEVRKVMETPTCDQRLNIYSHSKGKTARALRVSGTK